MRLGRIAIVGVGLIGGSFALAVRRAGLAERISGWDDLPSLKSALELGVIDEVEEAFNENRISQADLIYLAAPVGAIIDFLHQRASSIKPGAIVTDAGSTKRQICAAAQRWLPAEAHFVGGHPMAGSHKSGVEFASADLFRGAPYAIVSEEANLNGPRGAAISAVLDLVKTIGGLPVMLTPEEHDLAVARISHLPQLLSTALALVVARSQPSEAICTLAGSGFADMTRLARSHWAVWEGICQTNSDQIAAALADLAGEIEMARLALESGDLDKLRDGFNQANRFIEGLLKKQSESQHY
jgi:prephenate dehydrogenase